MIQNMTAFVIVKKIKPTTMKSSAKKYLFLREAQNFRKAQKFFCGKIRKFQNLKGKKTT
jgi:hypothetical protein